MGQKYAAYDSTGAIVALYDSVDSPVPHGATAIEITDTEWQSCLSNPGWTVANSSLVAPVAPTPAQIAAQQAAAAWSAYQTSAQVALDKSDVTILRCAENGVAVPAAWSTYRKALRAIVSAASGDAMQSLPARPAYPSGT